MALPDERADTAEARQADERFPKRFRILIRRDFLRIQGQGQRIHGKRLVFQFQPAKERKS